MNIYTQEYKFNADLTTAVGLFMGVRNKLRKPFLLEGNDYHSRSDSASIIGGNPLVEIRVNTATIDLTVNNETKQFIITNPLKISTQIQELLQGYTFLNLIAINGFLSYFGFEFSHFEETTVHVQENPNGLPQAHLILYEYLIHLDHFHNSGTILFNSFSPRTLSDQEFERLLSTASIANLPFEITESEETPVTDQSFLAMVDQAKQHIFRGDVFQLVFSRPFSQPFFGDDFQVYRELRRLNPSPYLFYVDFEDFRLMGSSPETQIQLKSGTASIHPIAGTVKKTGDELEDQQKTAHLIADEKENAEHTMLVDLARNDLSKYCTKVKVARYKEVQHFSHVIHLVSKVTGELLNHSQMELFSGTFPAGTLSGTPKPKALQLIQNYETTPRGYYGGAIGMLHANGSINLAIVIRSMLSKNNQLHYRAGAGIVMDSIPENELNEVDNKLGAVRRAIQAAQKPLFA